MKTSVALLLLFALTACTQVVHYHYHGLDASTLPKHDGLFSKDPHCSYTGKSSALNIFASKEGWYCDKGPWDNCTQQCDNTGCKWVCIKDLPNKVSAAKATGGILNTSVNGNVQIK